jgi:hypothetical protein
VLTSVTNRVNTFLLVLLVLMAGAIIGILANRAGAGPLDPPAAPSSTLHNIIYQPGSCAGFPIVISAPGSYLLGGDITGCPAKDGIEITTGNVTLDLSGHNVNGGGIVRGSLVGIKNVGANGQLSILHGRVQLWGGVGIDLSGSSTAQIDHVVATGNGAYGVIIDGTSTVTNTTASANAVTGIAAFGADNRIAACQADYIGDVGIKLLGAGNVVENCEVGSNSGIGVSGANISRIVRNHVHNNVSHGIRVDDSSTVEDNSSEWNGGDGILCGPNRCSVTGNSATANSGIGIEVSGGLGIIEGNHALGNVQAGISVFPSNSGYPNVVLRNVGTANGLGNYSIGINNDAGPQGTAALSTLPGTNFDQ